MNPRRDLLRLGLRTGLALAGAAVALPLRAQVAGDTLVLPAPASLQDAVADALRQEHPLIVMVSLTGCAFCKTVRQSYLGPMLAHEKLPIVQVDMRSSRTVLDFLGQPTTHDELVRGWKIRVAPTVLFLGRGGRELAPRLAGASLPDFYGAYLEQRIATARQALKQA